jgi:hypothetical protein
VAANVAAAGAARAHRRGAALDQISLRRARSPRGARPSAMEAARAELASRPWRPLARSFLRPRRPPPRPCSHLRAPDPLRGSVGHHIVTAASSPRRTRASRTGHLLRGPRLSGPHSGAGLAKARRSGGSWFFQLRLLDLAPLSGFSGRFHVEVVFLWCLVQLRQKSAPGAAFGAIPNTALYESIQPFGRSMDGEMELTLHFRARAILFEGYRPSAGCPRTVRAFPVRCVIACSSKSCELARRSLGVPGFRCSWLVRLSVRG